MSLLACSIVGASIVLSTKAFAADGTTVSGEIRDATTGEPVAARLYIQRDDDGTAHFARSASPDGHAVVYDKQNWINARSIERHTTLSAHPFAVDLPPGRYTFTVERGKEYCPGDADGDGWPRAVEVVVLAARGGSTSPSAAGIRARRTFIARCRRAADADAGGGSERRIAADVLGDERHSSRPPAGTRTVAGEIPDAAHHGRSTRTSSGRETRSTRFSRRRTAAHAGSDLSAESQVRVHDGRAAGRDPIAEQARKEGALFDLDKHDWPWAMSLVPSGRRRSVRAGEQSRLADGVRVHASSTPNAPPFLLPPARRQAPATSATGCTSPGTAYYTLLDCGYRLQPDRGDGERRASGARWVSAASTCICRTAFPTRSGSTGLAAGRSFVTTGPMLFARGEPVTTGRARSPPTGEAVCGAGHGEVVQRAAAGDDRGDRQQRSHPHGVSAESQEDADACDVIVECRCHFPKVRLGGRPRAGRIAPTAAPRFAHTAPVVGRRRRQAACVRGGARSITSSAAWTTNWPAAAACCRRRRSPSTNARATKYRRHRTAAVEVSHGPQARPTTPTCAAGCRTCLAPSVTRSKRCTSVTGLSLEELRSARAAIRHLDATTAAEATGDAPAAVLPYPGGRHPRTGFRDGAMRPQRDTKISVFPPWKDGGYVGGRRSGRRSSPTSA